MDLELGTTTILDVNMVLGPGPVPATMPEWDSIMDPESASTSRVQQAAPQI